MAKKKKDGASEFDAYYSGIWKDRWPRIKASFESEKENVSLSDKLLRPYLLDEASVIVASCLPVGGCDRVLDMCAAPGGKTLHIALRLSDGGSLVSNDRSPDRRFRLKNVISEHLPAEYAARITVTGHDAASWCLHEQNAYDKILLDAPCSSERHVYNDPKHLGLWSANRPRMLSVKQYAMLSSALICVRPGGLILYSTCSINPGEDEDVVAKLFKKHPGEVEEIPLIDFNGERCSFGYRIMPDSESGSGPMYCCLIKRVE